MCRNTISMITRIWTVQFTARLVGLEKKHLSLRGYYGWMIKLLFKSYQIMQISTQIALYCINEFLGSGTIPAKLRGYSMKWRIWVWMNVEWYQCGVFRATILEFTRRSWENSRNSSVWIVVKSVHIPIRFFQNANVNCISYTDLVNIFCIAWDVRESDKYQGLGNTMTAVEPSRC